MQNENIKILIIVPTLNSFNLLPRLINSLKAQNYDNWRLLFVDGESSKKHKEFLLRVCKENKNFNFINQTRSQKGIYGAMNIGFDNAMENEWILFWGSDDWAGDNNVLEKASKIIKKNSSSTLIVCKGKYGKDEKTLKRNAFFKRLTTKFLKIDSKEFRDYLLWGHSLPHQATIFSPLAKQKLSQYSTKYKLAADLDYFLKLSVFKDFFIIICDLEIVHMGDDGISGKETFLRLKEVIRSYYNSFKIFFLIPFFMRYVRRLISLLN